MKRVMVELSAKTKVTELEELNKRLEDLESRKVKLLEEIKTVRAQRAAIIKAGKTSVLKTAVEGGARFKVGSEYFKKSKLADAIALAKKSGKGLSVIEGAKSYPVLGTSTKGIPKGGSLTGRRGFGYVSLTNWEKFKQLFKEHGRFVRVGIWHRGPTK